MRLTRFLNECEQMPAGWGYAYSASYTMGSWIAPIPLNFIIGLWHNFYWSVLVCGWMRQDVLRRIRDHHYQQGWHRGYQCGFDDGVEHERWVRRHVEGK